MKKIVFLVIVLVLLTTAKIGRFIGKGHTGGTIYIRTDGGIEGTTDILTVDNATYTFTDNIYDRIVVARDSIVVDGAGYTLQGTGNEKGIYLPYRSNVTIKDVKIEDFTYGVLVGVSSNITLTGNTITNNRYGIYFIGLCDYNIISDNNVTNNSEGGISLELSSNNNIITGNTVTNNGSGILVSDSTNNSIYYNNFVNNTEQVISYSSTNLWDDDAGRGNYWSDYEERYPNSTEIDGTGIWDTPYVIDENNRDNYPLVPEFLTWTPILLMLIVLTVSIAIYKHRLIKTPIQ